MSDTEGSWDEYLEAGCAHLSRDPVMAELVASWPPPEQRSSDGLYVDLLDTIVSQQLSVKAAAAIMERFLDLFPGRDPEPDAILAAPEERLREAGLSRAKIRYVRGIARALKDGEIGLKGMVTLPDDEFIRDLTRLKGVGRWTAEMLLIFSLGRHDIFSVGDLGLRTAVARHYGIDRDDREAITRVSGPWSPFRSLACHYLWMSLSNKPSIGG